MSLTNRSNMITKKISESQITKEILIGERYVLDLRPLYYGISYLAAIVFLVGGGITAGAGFSYADTRNSNKEMYVLASKSDKETAKAITENIERQDADAIQMRDRAPMPPIAMIFGGISLFGCSIATFWITCYKQNFEVK